MNIGELVLSLGVKGTDKTIGAIGGVKKGLQDTASMSLEAKAAIIAAMYALERLFSTSGKAGTNLTNFNAITGDSIKTLQQYQYAARQVGVSNEEVEGSFKGLQSAMAKTLKGEAPPAGLARVSLLTGGLTQKDIEEYSKRPELLIQKLQQYAGKEKNLGLRNEVLKSFGLSEGMIAGLARNAFNPTALAKAPTYSDREVGQLDKANIAWSNLGNKIEMAIGHFNAKHGTELVEGISKIINAVVKLVGAFTLLAEKVHLFDGIAKLFDVTTQGISMTSGAVDTVTRDKKGLVHGGATLLSDLGGFLKTKALGAPQLVKQFISSPAVAQVTRQLSPFPSLTKQSAAPNVNHLSNNKATTNNNNVNVNNTFAHPGVDPKKVGSEIKKQIQQVVRTSHALTEGG